MPIKSMKCACCGSEDVFFAINLGTGQIRLYDNGCVEHSYDSDIYKYENDDGEVSILELLENIPLPQKDWNRLGLSGKLHHNPDHISCPSVSITGDCQKCENECSLIVRFEDGKKLGEKEALIKLVNELRNPTPVIVKSSSIKISTEYIKNLIPQYVKEHFGDSGDKELLNVKNWKRISKSKVNNGILRTFEYKNCCCIKLYITSDNLDSNILNHEITVGFVENTIVENKFQNIDKEITKEDGKYNHILNILKNNNSSKTAKAKAMAEAVNIAKSENKHLDGLKDMVRACTLDYKVQFDKITDEKVKESIRERVKSKEDGVIEIIEELNK